MKRLASVWLLATLGIIPLAANALSAAPISETSEPAAGGASQNGSPTGLDIPQTGGDAPAAVGLPGDLWNDPQFQSPEGQRARAALEAGNLDQCLAHLDRLVQEQPALPPPELLLADILLAKGHFKEGWPLLEKAAGLYKLHPQVCLTCGRVALAQGRYADAWVHLEKALAVEAPPTWSDEQRARFQKACYEALAIVAERRQDWATAAEIFAGWSGLQPDNDDVLDRWGQALFLSGQTREAYTKFAAAHLKVASRNPAELSMAALHAKIGQFAEAEKWYSKAIELHPDNSRVYFEYGSALLFEGRVADAKVNIEKAVELGTELDRIGTDLRLMRGSLARCEKDYEKAEGFFMEVLESSPGHFQALRQLPLVLVERSDEGKRRQALQLAMILAKKHPQSPYALATLGWVQYRSGSTAEAEQTLKAAAATGNIEALYYLGQILLEQGKTDEARGVIKSLEAAISQPGVFLLRNEARQWLKTVSLAFQ